MVGGVLRRKAQRKVSTRAFLLHAICIPNLAGSQYNGNCKIYYKIFNLNGDIAEVRRKFSELLTITINH